MQLVLAVGAGVIQPEITFFAYGIKLRKRVQRMFQNDIITCTRKSPSCICIKQSQMEFFWSTRLIQNTREVP